MDVINDDRNDYIDNIPGGELLINYRTNRRATIRVRDTNLSAVEVFGKGETQNEDMISLLTSRVANSAVNLPSN